MEKFVFASHLRKPKIRNKAHDFPKPITSQTLLSTKCRQTRTEGQRSDKVIIPSCCPHPPWHQLCNGGREGRHKEDERGSANGGQTISEAPAIIDTESARTEYVKGRRAMTRCHCDAFHNDTISSGEEWFCKGQLECHEGGQEVADGEQCYKFGLRMRRFVFCRPYIFTMIIHPSRAE